MEDLFYTCDHFPEVDKKYVDEAASLQYIERHRPALYIGDIARTFQDTDFFKSIKKDLLCLSPTYLKWPANTCYNWHTDGLGRKASINIPLVSSNKCLTLFKTKTKDSPFENLFNVNYIMYKPTILNVKHEHCVLNYSDQDRYVINISLNHVTYHDAVEYLKNLKVSEY